MIEFFGSVDALWLALLLAKIANEGGQALGYPDSALLSDFMPVAIKRHRWVRRYRHQIRVP